MKFRRTRAISIAALVAAGTTALLLVAVIGAAQAAPDKKIYDATVHVTGNAVTPTTATLTLTLKNDAQSNQTLGSANFTAPVGVNVTPGEVATDRPGSWTATSDGAVVAFRSTTALTKGQSVSANVTVGIDQTACSNALWTTRAKQSNDFSGNPGNDFALSPSASNLVPLGSLTIDTIATPLGAQLIQQIYVNQSKTVHVHAFDLCGEADSGYGTTAPGNFGDAASLAAKADTPARLVGSGLPHAIAWPAGTASMTPVVVETVDRVVATDTVSGINATSNDFDVVETICTFGTTCHWDNGNNKIHVDAPPPPEGASLGVGFSDELSFSCTNGTTPLGGALIYVSPRDYEPGETQSVTFTYDKTIPGTSGSVSSFAVCISKDNGVHWSAQLPDCADPAVAPCVQDRARVQGNLAITLFFDPFADPVGGMN